MSRVPIVDEARAVREAIAREHDYDLGAIFRMLREAGKKSGREPVSPAPPKVPPLPKAAQLHVVAEGTLAALRSRG